MTWSSTFAAKARAARTPPVYRVESLPPLGTGDRHVRYSSAPAPYHVEAVLADQCSVQWGGVQWPSCQTQASSCTIALIRERVDMTAVRLGTIVRVSMDLGGVIEPVFVGALTAARSDTSTGVMTWTLRGIEGALEGRYVDGTTESRSLFAHLGLPDNEGVVGTAYTAGDVAFGHTNLDLYRGGIGYYCLRMTPDSGTDFYLLSTGGTSTTRTGCLAGGALDTVIADAAVGNRVVGCTFEADHPVEIYRHAVDPDDTSWPDEWRMHLPAGTADTADMELERGRHTIILPGYGTSIQVVTESPQPSLSRWITPILAPLGIVPVQRHGMLTVRILRQHTDLVGEVVTADDILYASVEHWPSWRPAEYMSTTDRSGRPGIPVIPSDIVDPSSPVAGDPWGALLYVHHLLGLDPPPPPVTSASLTVYNRGNASTFEGSPGQGMLVDAEHARRIPSYGGAPGALGTSVMRSRWRADVSARLAAWICDRPEVVTVALPGWWDLAIGDGLALDIDLLTSRDPSTTSLRGAVGLIVGGGPDIFGSTTTYKVLVMPEGAAS